MGQQSKLVLVNWAVNMSPVALRLKCCAMEARRNDGSYHQPGTNYFGFTNSTVISTGPAVIKLSLWNQFEFVKLSQFS
jgi:hypothetical protein